MAGSSAGKGVVWDTHRVMALRRHLEMTQEQIAREMGVRQQTISEWETGVYRPRGASRRLLTLIAERTQFTYGSRKGEEGNGEQEE